METWDAITSRRNVRSFTDRPIPSADLDRILEAGRRAPSSQNWQPWDFIVVTDREQLRALARVWRGAGHVAGSAATIVVIGPPADATPDQVLSAVEARVGELIRAALGHPGGPLAGACEQAGGFLRSWWGEPPRPPFATAE